MIGWMRFATEAERAHPIQCARLCSIHDEEGVHKHSSGPVRRHLDRHRAVHFLIDYEDEGVELAECPPYVREWMLRECAGAAGLSSRASIVADSIMRHGWQR